MPAIRGINKTKLWNTWKIVRKELRNASIRDVMDFVDCDIDPDKWIQKLLDQISVGKYEPAAPFRFTIGKSNGFSRTMTQPAIPDLVLYRAIVDTIYFKSLRREHPHVYFKRERLQQAHGTAQRHAAMHMNWTTSYRMTSKRMFYNWLRYGQYRKLLLLRRVHPYVVVTDVTNFFDSVLHSHVEEALRGLSVAPRMVGLLFFLLERFSIAQDYSSSHGISLPVDEFDCSRTLAHMTLFTHDDAMVRVVGEDNYVRWMDDQIFGAQSKARGLGILSQVGMSLAKLHLSANTRKSKILTIREARRHFHLDLNAMLDNADQAAKSATTRRLRIRLATEVRKIWTRARRHDGVGEFDKILKRLYRLAGFCRLRFLRQRALQDVLSNPDLAERVCAYVRWSGTASEYLKWSNSLMQHDEQVYPDVNVRLIESLLRLEPTKLQSIKIRALAARLLAGKSAMPGAVECRALAPLLVLRFADRRSLPLLKRCLDDDNPIISAPLLRSVAVVYSSYGDREFAAARRSAARLMRNHLAEVIRLVERIREYVDVPIRYRDRLNTRYDSVGRRHFVDMRAVLTVRLLRLSKRKRVLRWVANWKAQTLAKSLSRFDRRIVKRLT